MFKDMCFFSRNLLLRNPSSQWVRVELHAEVAPRFRVFDDRVSIEDCGVLNDMMIEEYCPGAFLEGKSQKHLAR
jgi:hypothetical protein